MGGSIVGPVSGAVVATAASAGKALDKAGVWKALLLPMAKAYGDHWGQQAQQRIAEAIEAKKLKNLSAHIEAVEERAGPEADPDPDPEMLLAWMEGAARVDPHDEELAAAWRGVFDAIAAGDVYRTRMLAAARSLTPDEAHAFLNISRMQRLWGLDSMQLDYHKKFRDLGLIEKPVSQIIRLFVMAIPGMAVVAAGYYYYFPPFLVAGLESLQAAKGQVNVKMAATAIFLLLIALIASAMFRLLLSTRLTTFGRSFLRRARTYLTPVTAK